MTAFDSNWEIQPNLKMARTRNMSPEPMVMAATIATASSDPFESPAARTAPAATAASAELGPVAICFEVPNSA